VGAILDEVVGPDMVRVFRPQPNARSIVEPEPASLRLLLRDGLPPEKWSSLMYGLWPDGGLKDAKEETHG